MTDTLDRAGIEDHLGSPQTAAFSAWVSIDDLHDVCGANGAKLGFGAINPGNLDRPASIEVPHSDAITGRFILTIDPYNKGPVISLHEVLPGDTAPHGTEVYPGGMWTEGSRDTGTALHQRVETVAEIGHTTLLQVLEAVNNRNNRPEGADFYPV